MNFDLRPSVAAYMFKAFLPSKGVRPEHPIPDFQVTWNGWQINREYMNRFYSLCGMEKSLPIPIIFPQVAGFPLIMSVLTHPDFPEPIWNALQTRNRLIQFRPLGINDKLDFKVELTGQRWLKKGIEVDLAMKVRANDLPAWESVTTMYYRGNFGGTDQPAVMANPPETIAGDTVEWRMPGNGGWGFGGLTGDYNGIHWSDLYARAFGFRHAFMHPHRVVGQLMARMKKDHEIPQQLDLWFRGPVAYNADVKLVDDTRQSGNFALYLQNGDNRPCLIGSLAPPESR